MPQTDPSTGAVPGARIEPAAASDTPLTKKSTPSASRVGQTGAAQARAELHTGRESGDGTGLRAAVGQRLDAGVSTVRSAASAAGDGIARAAGSAKDAVLETTRAVGRAVSTTDSATGAQAGGPVAMTLRIPLAAGVVQLPSPGAVATVGPVRVTLPTGALYYGGLVALAFAGALELPVAAGAAVAGALVGRRWLADPLPRISVCDSEAGSGPVAREKAGPKDSPS